MKNNRKWEPIIELPYEPPPVKRAAPKRLDPEYANRKILALKAMLRDGDITKQQFTRLKSEIIARVVAL
jgi:hypothetical protein